MPLARFQVRNEYGLGAQELYKEANYEEPKAILDGVAVAGLVGILRQLGDLAEFAAEVFHGLQEQVATTASRSHKMLVRVQRIEAALPPLEKAVLAQTSHIHFAYTAGCEWHPKIRVKQKHFIHSDLPHFILDSYEECHDPPRLHLLDKFDIGGPGACLQRYSDPSFFRKAITRSEPMIAEKFQREKRIRKKKKRSSRWRHGEFSHAVSTSQCSDRMQFGSPNSYGQSSTGETVSTIHTRPRSEQGDRDVPFDSRTRLGYVECVFEESSSMQHEDKERNRFPTATMRMHGDDATDFILPDKQNTDDNMTHQSLSDRSTVTWDEKIEIVDPKDNQSTNIVGLGGFASELLQESVDPAKELREAATENQGLSSELPQESVDLANELSEAAQERNIDPEDIMCVSVEISETLSEAEEYGEVGSEPDKYADALNILESETETEPECQTKRELEKLYPNQRLEEKDTGKTHKITRKPEMLSVNFGAKPYSLLERQVSSSYTSSVYSENAVGAQPSEPATISVDDDESAGSGVLSVPRLDGCESPENNPLPSLSSVLKAHPRLYDEDTNTLHESQGSIQEVSETSAVNVWTNGGLLGLEPSKPPDQGMSKGHHNPMDCSEGRVSNLSINVDMPESHLNKLTRNVGSSGKGPEQREKIPKSQVRDESPDLVNPNELHSHQLITRTKNKVETVKCYCCTSPHDKQGGDKLQENSLENLSTLPVAGYVNSVASSECHSLTKAPGRDPKETRVTTSADEVQMFAGIKRLSSESGQKNIDMSMNTLGLSQKFHGNGHLGKESVVHDDTSDPSGNVKTGIKRLIEPHCTRQIGKGKVVDLLPGHSPNSQLENGSPQKSPPPSPPLEHMKISFHPMDGFETSKLRLKFPGGYHFHEGIKDVIFPSFQLLPEPATLLQDVDSESDSDTFCRSSLCMSEELMSQHSDSSSEQWESDGTPGRKDHEIYDALHKVSSVESISSAFELEKISCGNSHFDNDFRSPEPNNDAKKFHCDALFDLPNFGSVDLLYSQQEKKSDSCAKDHQDLGLEYPKEPVPPPPPLPPVEWRATQPHFGGAASGPVFSSKVADCSNNQLVPGGTWPSEADSPKLPHINDTDSCFLRSKQDPQKLYGNRGAGQAENFKDTDEREDLLSQIRSKSFNLRPTVPLRPTIPEGPTANNKVTAILQKANAIRQAYMGSDEGGDENWSDE